MYLRLALLFSITCPLLGCGHSRGDVVTPSQTAVEHGLLPAVVHTGQPLPSWSIQDRMERYHVPGTSIAVINGGRLDWAEGYGVTRVNGASGVSKSTVFQAASISKVVTATGALRLVQDGVLDLDSDVNVQLRTWKVPVSQYTNEHAVTLRRLLSHTASLSVPGFPGYADGQALPDLRQILEGASPANSAPVLVDAIPGSRYRYSGGGYEIVQQLVEDATGRSFADVMQEDILGPVGMNDSSFTPSFSAQGKSMVACGHSYQGKPVEGCWHRYPEMAAAGLWTTPSDLARLGVALSDAVDGRTNPILNRATADLILTRVIDDSGLGPGVHGEGRNMFFDHAGWNHGFRAYMAVYPYLGKGVVVMSNGDGGDVLIREIVRATARTYQWPDFEPQRLAAVAVEPAVLEGLTGDYEVPDRGLVISVTRENDHLIVSTPRGSWYSFYPTGDHEYHAIEDGSALTFTWPTGSGLPSLSVWGMTGFRKSARAQSHSRDH